MERRDVLHTTLILYRPVGTRVRHSPEGTAYELGRMLVLRASHKGSKIVNNGLTINSYVVLA